MEILNLNSWKGQVIESARYVEKVTEKPAKQLLKGALWTTGVVGSAFLIDKVSQTFFRALGSPVYIIDSDIFLINVIVKLIVKSDLGMKFTTIVLPAYAALTALVGLIHLTARLVLQIL